MVYTIFAEDFNMYNHLNNIPNEEATDDIGSSLIKNHVSGGLPMISDSMFSLVILIYVSVAFCLVFFMFCWKSESGGGRDVGIKHQCILMANDIARRGGNGDLPTQKKPTTTVMTTAGAAPVTLKKTSSMSEEDIDASAVDATGIPMLTTDDKRYDEQFDARSKECQAFFTQMPTAARDTLFEGMVVCRKDNTQAVHMAEEEVHISIKHQTTEADI